jgi:alpha-tubulin suppressor-like RCC1 family protein
LGKCFGRKLSYLAIKTDGTLWAWGKNDVGQLGLGNTTNQYSPVQVGSGTTWASVTAGYAQTLARKTDGTLWAWGSNEYGQLGIGNTTNQSDPVQVGSGTTWASVAAGSNHTLARKTDGTLWAWGYNGNGQLGIGNNTQQMVPVQVGSGTTWASVSAVGSYTLARKTNGTLWAWGDNYYGQLGIGTSGLYSEQYSPVQVGSGTTWASVTAGIFNTLAIKTDGTLWAWGYNDQGELGIGNTTNQSVPVQVGSGTTWASVTAGQYHTLAIKIDGTLWAWGSNGSGQLGIGNTTQQNNPVQMVGAAVTASQTVVVNTAGLTNNGPLTCSLTSVTLIGTGVGTYAYSGGSASVTTPGTYTVTVTGATGCTATTTVTQNTTAPTAGLTNNGPLTCSMTSVTLTATGSGTYAYSAGSSNITTPGTYTVTVTSTNGCTATATTEVMQDIATPSAGLGNNGPLTCSMTSVTLTATGSGTYAYSAGPSNITTPGTYTVTVTSTNGCTATATTEVMQDIATPSAGLGNNGPLTCSMTSVTLTATGSGTYAYSAGPSNITTPGTYTVTVTSTNGCTATATTEVMQDIATPSAGLTNNGPLTCTLTSVTLTGTGGGTYAYSAGPSNITTPGTYTVTVTSTNGCTATATIEVMQDITTPSAGLGNNGPLTCSMTSVTLTATGSGTYAYSAGPSNITTPSTYIVTVTSTNGCTATATTEVMQDIATPSAGLGNNGPLTCSMTSVTLTATGSGTYAYSAGPSNITTPGTYTVTVTSTNGCTATATTEVMQDITTPSAGLGNNGPLTCSMTSVTLTGTGGGTYAYSGGSASVSTAGAYTVTVTGSNGCTATATTVVIGSSTPPTATASNNGHVCEGGTATLSVNPNLPVGVTATYAWSGPAGTASTQNPNIPNMAPSKTGLYTVTVTYSNGCTATATTVLAINPKPVVSSVVGNCVSGIGRITVNATGTGLTYNRGTGAQTNNVFIGVANGTYMVTITNAIGCTATAKVTVNCAVCPTVVANSNSPVCTGGNIMLSVNPNLPVGVTATYSWSGPGGTATLQNPTISNATPTKAGIYTVTVTYSNGCTATASTTATMAPSIAGSIIGSSTFCIGGSAVLTATGGLNYVWSTSATTPSITITTAGTYVVTITNGLGCKRVSKTVTTTTCKNTTATMPETLLVTPNPFATRATIEFMTNSNGHTSINVYSIDGKQLATLYNANTQAGEIYQVTLDGANLPRGMYFVEMTNANGKKTLVKAVLSN